MCIVSKKRKKLATNAFIEDILLKTIPVDNEELLYQNVPWRNIQRIIQQRCRQKSISNRKMAHWMHFRPLNPKRVIEDSLLLWNVLAKKIWDRTLSGQAFMTLCKQRYFKTFIPSVLCGVLHRIVIRFNKSFF